MIAEKELIKASQILNTEKLRDVNDIKLDKIELALGKQNFKINYFETRIATIKEGTKTIAEYEWNGDTKLCKKGVIPNYIQQKVEDRINYFRVSAGVPPIYLDSQLNDWCQRAALVMESNNKLNHELPKIWSCYSPEAAEAAKYSLLTQNAISTLAVTSFVADQTHPTLGNRRWMLYPYSMVWGHGSTKSKCVLWALDDSRMKDTLYYKANFIAWPYNGYINKMFLFKKWSFSINDSLKDAQVSMIMNKVPIKLKLETAVDGYGLPTLVWTPELDVAKLKEGDKIDVTVKLKGNKTYYYTVKIFEYTP
ncbi:MAG: CAP domain-containing protein [Bacteroidia bacterium]